MRSPKLNELAVLEPILAEVKPGVVVQFERLGYFCADSVESGLKSPVFNRTITLKDSWAKLARKK